MRIQPIKSSVGGSVAPTVRAPLGITSGFTQGLGQMGQAIGETGRAANQVSQTLQIIESRKKAFDDSVSLSELTGKAKLSLFDHESAIQYETDYLDIEEAHKEGIDRIREETFNEASAINPEVAASWKKVWSTLETSSSINVKGISTERFRQRTIAGTIEYINLIENEAVGAVQEGDTEKLTLLNQSVVTAADNLRKNFKVPGRMAEGLKENYKRGVNAKVAKAEQDAQKAYEKGLVTRAYLGISQTAKDPVTGKIDYDVAYEILRQPSTLGIYDITAEQKKELTGIFTNEQAREKEFDDKLKEDERVKLQQRVANGSASFEEIDASTLDAAEKYTWKTRLLARSKAINAGDEDPFKKTDPAVDNDMLQRIYSVNPPTVEDIRALVGNGLSVKRSEHWINVLKKPDAGYKRGLDYLKGQITPKKGLLVGESTEESKAYWMAVMALDDEIKKAETKGQPLTGNEILKKSMEIAPLHQLSITERIDAMKRQLKPTEKKTVRQEISEEIDKIVRTGKDANGRKVVQHESGKVEYAD